MKRREAVLTGVVAAVAGAAGVTAGMLRRPASPRADVDAPAPAPDLWAMSFATIDGKALAMSTLRGRPLLLNFWATWCAPCATEMPLLDAFAASPPAAGWNVLALAIDDASAVRKFIDERKLRLPVALADSAGLDLSRRLGNNAGALPYSVAFDAAGQPREHHLGMLDAELLARWVQPSS